MTRFARAKGSKASNERLPDEPTPWHIMKQQLEDSVASKSPQVPTKSAKELLREREEPYYGDLGAVNNDWAEIEPERKNPPKKEEPKNSPAVKKNKKKHLEPENGSANTSITSEGTVPSPKKSKKRKSSAPSVESTPKPSEIPKSVENNPPEEKKQKIVEDSIEKNQKILENPKKPEEKKKKKKNRSKNKSSSSPDDSNPQKPESTPENPQKTEESDKPSVKLSKRQKRNRKNKIKNSETGDSEAKEDTKTSPGGFNTEGNDWSTEIKFSTKKKLMRPTEEVAKPTDDQNPQKSISNPKKEDSSKPFNKFDNQKVQKKRKPPKVRDENEHKRRKPDPGVQKVIINGLEIEIVMYDGFPVKKEDAERLKELRKQMIMKGIPKSEINAAMKLERRKAEKALTRVKKTVCFHCRKAGHNLSDCPDLGEEESATGICFKCGSTEHTHLQCRVTKKEEFGFAKCFICREQGHIAKQCPDNPKGLYPDGGCCKNCGDVTHLRKDCPDVVSGKEENVMTLETIDGGTLEDLEGVKKVQVVEKPKQKIVTF